MINTALIVRVPSPVASGYGKTYSYFCLGFRFGLGSLEHNLGVQVWFRFTEVKFAGSVWVHQNETVHSGLQFGLDNSNPENSGLGN